MFGERDWWKLVKSFFKKQGVESDGIPPIEFDGNYYLNSEKADMLNDFFIKQSTLEHDDDTPPNLPKLDCKLNNIILTVPEVTNAIRNLDKTKAPGPDLVHNRS